MTIRRLPQHLINRIAAGEVVERPASVVKELAENAADSGADAITITVRQAGRNLIRIEDNGNGIAKDELPLCLERHATSKLPDDDLWNIRYMGFRGEALASIASVSRIRVASLPKDAGEAWEITCEGGGDTHLQPSAHGKQGTVVEIKDLFFAVPARLKFLKHDRTELNRIAETVYRLALAHPHIAFTLKNEQKEIAHIPVCEGEPRDCLLKRLCGIVEPSFADNALYVDYAQENGYTLTGFAGLPTYHRSSANHLYLFVNHRPVKDKLLHGAVRAAYQDYLPRMRFPVVALFLQVPPQDLDVNVHPAKTEVRFRHEDRIRALLIKGLREALRDGGFRTATTITQQVIAKARPSAPAPSPSALFGARPEVARVENGAVAVTERPENAAAEQTHVMREPERAAFAARPNPSFPVLAPAAPKEDTPPAPSPAANAPAAARFSPDTYIEAGFLGTARCQVHDNYIIAQHEDGIVIVDQHAAHERLRYERYKQAVRDGSVAVQPLLIPEIIELGKEDFAALEPHCPGFARLGLDIAAFGASAVTVRGTPALLGECDIPALVRELADDIRGYGRAFVLEERLDEILSSVACRGAIRSGNRISIDEMNALLREMEITPYSGQCNHGRPTYVTLKLKDIERLFGRS